MQTTAQIFAVCSTKQLYLSVKGLDALADGVEVRGGRLIYRRCQIAKSSVCSSAILIRTSEDSRSPELTANNSGLRAQLLL